MKDNILKDLEKKANKARWAFQNKQNEYNNKIALPNLRKMVGKCFKYHNSYGGDLPRWFLYSKVISIDEKTLTFTCISFQRTSLEKVDVELEKKFNFNGKNYFDGSNYIPVSSVEYNRAKKSLLKFMQDKLSI